MFGSEILEVAIGLVFLYLLLCFVCSAIQEVIAAWFKLRARNLRRALLSLLGPDYTSKVLNHGMIRGMRAPVRLDQDEGELELIADTAKKGSARMFPSYIPGRTFASIMIDLIAGLAKTAEQETRADTAPAPERNPATELSSASTSQALRQGLAQITEPRLREAFRAVLAGTDGDLAKACAAIQNWYDDSMERASGWYKRRVQLFLFIIGLVVVLLTNADSIAIGKTLAVDDDLRRTVADNATKFVEQASEDCDAVAEGEDLNESVEHAENAFERLNASQLPLGWTREEIGWGSRNPLDPYSWNDAKTAAAAIVRKLPGLLITVFAIMLGAPFWFELLNKLANLRSSGLPPKTRREEEMEEQTVVATTTVAGRTNRPTP